MTWLGVALIIWFALNTVAGAYYLSKGKLVEISFGGWFLQLIVYTAFVIAIIATGV